MKNNYGIAAKGNISFNPISNKGGAKVFPYGDSKGTTTSVKAEAKVWDDGDDAGLGFDVEEDRQEHIGNFIIT